MMKAKNIKVGEYVVAKHGSAVFKVDSEFMRDDVRVNSSAFRRPRISDLQAGDVFEWDDVEFEMQDPNGDFLRVCRVAGSLVCSVPRAISSEKIRIISLAEEKQDPRKGEVECWVNVYEESATFNYTKVFADELAHSQRLACVKVTIPWTEGVFDE